jgi:hypothetical protein
MVTGRRVDSQVAGVTRRRHGWSAKIKRSPPISLYVPLDEGGATLWGVPEIDYSELVAHDRRTTTHL